MSELRLDGVSKSFGAKQVFAPLDLSVKHGAFVALLGPSGCGKTTLLRVVAGLEVPTTGEIRLGERRLFGPGVNVPPEERGFGMVFQSYAVWPHMTVAENVTYPLRIRGVAPAERERRVAGALELVHLESLRDRRPHQLSGGQQQRVALARGLVMEPPVLLLDEPLSNLDARLRAEMRREIRDLHRRLGITILYVTHDQREAFEMSSYLVVLNEGRVEQEGTPEEVRARPAAGFVRDFLAES
jgi:ABC-type Fe3+/spermidine/putrescine transport system ATPase subunit